MKITAALLDTIGQAGPFAETRPLRLAEVDLAPPRPGELLVRIEAAGLCHSDLSVINGDRPRPMPMALGHEAVATIVEIGDPAESELAVGDRVVLSFLPACGRCPACAAGEGYLCGPAAAANGAGRLMLGGERLCEAGHAVHHHLGVSAFATHAVVDRRSAVKVPSDIPVEIAALFGCAVLTGVGAVFNSAVLRPGESIVIYGLGGIGLAAMLGALAGGAQPVMVIDPIPEKRALAIELGAAGAFEPEGAEAAIEAMLGRKPDIVIETVGKATVLAAAYALGRRGARIVTVGLPNPAEQLSISAVSLVAEGKALIGSYMGSSIPARDIPRYIALWRAGRLPVERLLTSVSPLSDINGLLDKLASGAAIRQIVIPLMAIRKAYVDGPHGQIHLRQNDAVKGRKSLICLHATAYSSQTFTPLLEAYDGIRRVIAIDAPGYGGSDAPDRPVDLAGYADAIGAAITACCDGPVDLLGYHTGAYIAAQLALSDPARISALVLIGVPYFQALGFDEWRARLSAPHMLGDGLDQFAERWDFLVANRAPGLSLPRAFENFVDELRAWPNGSLAHEAMFAWDSDLLLPQIAQPVLIINPNGHLAPASRAAAALMQDVRIDEMPDLEGAIFEQAPDRIRDAIEAFRGASG